MGRVGSAYRLDDRLDGLLRLGEGSRRLEGRLLELRRLLLLRLHLRRLLHRSLLRRNRGLQLHLLYWLHWLNWLHLLYWLHNRNGLHNLNGLLLCSRYAAIRVELGVLRFDGLLRLLGAAYRQQFLLLGLLSLRL